MAKQTPFQTQIQAALADAALQSALDGNAERRQNAFRQAYASLPQDLQTMRQRAHAIRADVIANLEEYLEQFAAKAQANGIQVHLAADAAQAVQIVRQIARDKNARLITKSKSMVSEEIHLNQALEADGLQVIETDLGEYIVQLRGEPPAHIITPAVHLSRGQVGETFQQKLGIEYSEDIPTLTNAARRELRQAFLDSDIGISGVNFGVVESGALCLVTNEGNGRMVTTLPDTHIAVMGAERLAPTMADLATLLYLLPRSATGQKLTVYVNLISSARQPGEIDGPSERHLIILDNGRLGLRASPLAEALMCIRCGACLNACPVFREIGGHAYVGAEGQGSPYPGPIGSVISPGIFGVAEFGHLARASSLCGACKEACPVDIDLPSLLLRVRADGAEAAAATASAASQPLSPAPRALQLGLRLFTWFSASPQRFALAQRLARVFSRLLGAEWLRMPAISGWGLQRDFPRPAARPFRTRFEGLQPAETADIASPSAAGAKPPEMDETPGDLAARFTQELKALGGVVTHCTANELAAHLITLLKEKGIDRIQAWDEGQLPAGILQAIRNAGVQVSQAGAPALRAGLTGAQIGIAESGTLALSAGTGRPLSASLLPEIHIAILRKEDIRLSLPEAFELIAAQDTSSSVLISGPSRTADIEMTLTIGVHGPRELFVYCIRGDEEPNSV